MPIAGSRLSCFRLTILALYFFLPASPLHAQEPNQFVDEILMPQPTAVPPPPDSPVLALAPPGMFGDFFVLESFAPAAFRSAFEISQNETPQPLDRVFVTGNYYRDVRVPGAGGGYARPLADTFREMIGFEKTFLQGDASIGLRVPYYQPTGNPLIGDTHIGDISVLFKYAFVNNPATGKLLSAGLVLTAPTGPSIRPAGQSQIDPVFVQPWFGSIWSWKGVFVENFLSLAVPTDARDVTFFFKDISVGYWLYRSDDARRFLNAIVPDIELHLDTPLDHRGSEIQPIGVPELIAVTGGFYFYLHGALLGIAADTPLTGPKPYDYQILANLNYRF